MTMTQLIALNAIMNNEIALWMVCRFLLLKKKKEATAAQHNFSQ